MDDRRITVSQYFCGLPLRYQPDSNCDYVQRAGFDKLTNDCLNRYAAPCRQYKHWPELLECCQEIIDKIAELPFAGNITLAKIMADGMELLKKKHGFDAPPPWYPTIKRLREMRDRKVHF